LVLAVLLFAMVSANVVRGSRERVARAWTEVEAAVDARASVAGRMARAVGAYAGDLPEVTELAERAAAAAAARVEDRESAELALVAALRQVLRLVAQYPELQGDPTYRDLQGQLDEVQGRVTKALGAYASCAQRLNKRVETRSLRPAAAALRCAAAAAFDPGDPVAPR
jgi:hypothetical protein